MNDSVLACHDLVRTFQEGPLHAEVLRSINLTINAGECIAIVIMDAGALEESRRLMLMLEKYFPDIWAMRFRGHDYEVGHWDGLRLREILLPNTQAGITNII